MTDNKKKYEEIDIQVIALSFDEAVIASKYDNENGNGVDTEEMPIGS